MFDNIVSYIRSWFPATNEVTRKRRACDNFSELGVRKYRKVLSPMSNNVEDNFDELFSSSIRMPTRRSFDCRSKVFDDDRTGNFEIKTKLLNKSRSPYETKTSKLINGGDDVIFVGEKMSAERKLNAKRAGLEEFIPSSAKSKLNGTRPKISPIKKISPNPPITSFPSLDYSIRLEDKKKYKALLDSVYSSSNAQSSVYSTPVGKFYNKPNNSRGKMLVELAKPKLSKDKRPMDIVDLTEESIKRLSTKETVIKVLDDFETNVIEDSDSDVEILPTPPSPKPDIKVDPINSLKTIIDSSNVTRSKWIDDVSERYDRMITQKRGEVEVYSENSKSLNQINHELLLKSLTRKINESLAIKDSILPIEEEEEEIELPPLTDEQIRMVKRGLSGDPNEVLTKQFNLNVTRRDIQTLSGLNWLNDNVINFYMNLIIERGKDSRWPAAYAMNTFFFQRLMSTGPESLRRWTRKVDIFAQSFICVPIHLGMHWCMAIIDLNERSIRYFDSMGKPNNQCLLALKNYLEYEHLDKKNETYDTSDFILENMQDIPQQMNGSDCGMFACTFAEFATRKARFTFQQEDMPYLRKKMVIEILEGHLLIQ